VISVLFLSVFVFLIVALIVLAGAAFLFSNSSLNELWEEESWIEPVVYALLACLAALLLSFVNIRVLDAPVSVSLNVTGVLIPVSVSLLLVALRRIKLVPAILSVLVVSVFGFFIAGVGPGGIRADFPFWLVPSGVAALCGYYFSSRKDPLEMASISYVAGSMGMLLGGDVAHVLPYAASGSNAIVLGAGGLSDFVFLSGIVSIAMLWSGWMVYAALRRRILNGTFEANA
jgi:uncharacterized membrane protein